jgi:hypothetical protein
MSTHPGASTNYRVENTKRRSRQRERFQLGRYRGKLFQNAQGDLNFQDVTCHGINCRTAFHGPAVAHDQRKIIAE